MAVAYQQGDEQDWREFAQWVSETRREFTRRRRCFAGYDHRYKRIKILRICVDEAYDAIVELDKALRQDRASRQEGPC